MKNNLIVLFGFFVFILLLNQIVYAECNKEQSNSVELDILQCHNFDKNYYLETERIYSCRVRLDNCNKTDIKLTDCRILVQNLPGTTFSYTKIIRPSILNADQNLIFDLNFSVNETGRQYLIFWLECNDKTISSVPHKIKYFILPEIYEPLFESKENNAHMFYVAIGSLIVAIISLAINLLIICREKRNELNKSCWRKRKKDF